MTRPLTDAATGGVMLERLGVACNISRVDDGEWILLVRDGAGSGATLAEAVARAAVALGRAG